MSGSEPLDLNKVDPSIWRVLVSDEIYGPYTLGQIRQFIKEGRIGARSKIAEGNTARFVAAASYPKLGIVFDDQPVQPPRQKSANLVVIARLHEDNRALVGALNQLGAFGEAMPGVYLLRSSERLSEIHTRLSTVARDGEQIMIVDASNDRLAWLGLGADADTHVKAVWSKAA